MSRREVVAAIIRERRRASQAALRAAMLDDRDILRDRARALECFSAEPVIYHGLFNDEPPRPPRDCRARCTVADLMEEFDGLLHGDNGEPLYGWFFFWKIVREKSS